MRLTRAGEYAVRCVLFLSGRGKGAVINRKEIARQMEIPEQFLTKIAQNLGRAGILEIVQGARGGFRLKKSPKSLNLLEVIEAVIGEVFLSDCLMRPESCFRNRSCSVNRVWERARKQLRETLRETTFSGLLDEESCFPAPLIPMDQIKKTASGR
jgi:Rrf2 family protein